MRLISIALAGSLLLTVGVSAQNVDIINKRQDIYKSFGKATKPLVPMLKGEAPFDLKIVQDALATYSKGSKALPALFPDDSKVGSDTEALPAIWDNKADFESRLKKFGADSDADMASITDQASFTAHFPDIAKQCGGCHKLYRAKSDK